MQGGVLHDGMLMTLWIAVLGEAEALDAWKPSFLWPSGSARSLYRFPARAVAGLANCNEEETAKRWSESAYFQNFYTSSSSSAARDILRVVVGCCRTNPTELFAVSRGYISA